MELVSLMIMGLGLLALAAIYMVSRMSRQEMPRKRDEAVPVLRDADGRETSSILEDVPARDGKRPSSNARSLSDVMTPEKTAADPYVKPVNHLPPQLVLFVAADAEGEFHGHDVLQALNHAGLSFGDMGIYHRIVLTGSGETSLYSVANGIKPWTLIPDEIMGQTTPGLSMILNLPSPINNKTAIQDFLRAAEQIADELQGVLKDEEQQPVTPQYRASLLNLVA